MKIIEIEGSKKVVFTVKEVYEIKCLLETLEAMGGTLDEDFNNECKRAGIITKRMNKSIRKIDKEIEL